MKSIYRLTGCEVNSINDLKARMDDLTRKHASYKVCRNVSRFVWAPVSFRLVNVKHIIERKCENEC